MNKPKLAYPICVLTLLLLGVGGCKSEDGGAVAGTAEDASNPAAIGPGNTGPVGNASPEIWGAPEMSAVVGTEYHFQPEASDSDGDVLQFSIANKPGWADFESLTGNLHGTPGSDDVGQDSHIVISVTDGNSVSSLASFTVEVSQVYTPSEDGGDEIPSSEPPVISGTPNASAVVGAVYSFLPDASDADGDELSFSIVNKPTWATFDATTGLLEGTPANADVGTSDAIQLSVTDGTSIAALEKFAITVDQVGPGSFTISWVAPTQNEDGSALTDLAGYRIYFGTTAGKYSEEILLTSPGATTYVIENLAPGKYFLVMSSVNTGGLESKYTPELAFDLGG